MSPRRNERDNRSRGFPSSPSSLTSWRFVVAKRRPSFGLAFKTVGWVFDKQPSSALHLTWPFPPGQPGVVLVYIAKRVKGRDVWVGLASDSVPCHEEPQRGHIPDLASRPLASEPRRGSLQHHHDGKNCPPRRRFPLFSQAPRTLPLFVYLRNTTLCLGPAVIYGDRDESTKARDRGNIYTVTSQTGSLTGKRWNVCLFEGRWGGIGLVCFGVVVLALVPPPTRIHCCLFGHQFTPLTSPNGWLIPVKATVGPFSSTSSNVASLWTDLWTPPSGAVDRTTVKRETG